MSKASTDGRDFTVTIYYNLAWVCQKLSKLEECVKYLEKAIEFLNEYCERTTQFLHTETTHKLIYKRNWSEFQNNNGDKGHNPSTKSKNVSLAEEYNDLLMKYRYLTKFNLQYWAVLSQLSQ